MTIALDQVRSQWLPCARQELCCERAVELGGQKFTPDPFRAYLKGELAYAYPVVTAYGSAFHAGTVFRSHSSMLHQPVNFQHEMAANSAVIGRDIREDRMMGMVVGVAFPPRPAAGFELASVERTPHIDLVMSLSKRAKGMKKILGEIYTGAAPWTLSLEVNFLLGEGGVLLSPPAGEESLPELPDDLRAISKKTTPDDYARAGLHYLPWEQAEAFVGDCWNDRKGVFTKRYKGRDCVNLLGGIDGAVNFYGVALVNYGAEPTAAITDLLARHPDDYPALIHGLDALADLLSPTET